MTRYKIPNPADAFAERNSAFCSADLDILVMGQQGSGLIGTTGCACTAQGTPDMTVAVASGIIQYVDTTVVQATVAGGNVTIAAADPSNARFDLIVASNTGVKSVVQGTAAAKPVTPALPATSIGLWRVWVPAGATSIITSYLQDGDRRVFVADRLTVVITELQTKRIRAVLGTALEAGDFALSAGWGSTASVGAITANDQRGTFTVTSAGTGHAANPTITLTFTDGTWTTAPLAHVFRRGGAQTGVPLSWVESATQLVITFAGTPIAGEQYVFGYGVL